MIIDEAHERTTDTDLLLGLIKTNILNKNNEQLNLVVMSATLDSHRFKT